MAYLVFCNTEENGDIKNCISGERIIPEKEYEHFFFLAEEVDLDTKKVIDGELVDK